MQYLHQFTPRFSAAPATEFSIEVINYRFRHGMGKLLQPKKIPLYFWIAFDFWTAMYNNGWHWLSLVLLRANGCVGAEWATPY